MLTNSSILVTGGTGSFGNTFVPMTLTKFNPKKIIIFSRDEMKQWEMAKKFQGDERVRFFIGDIRDRERLYRALDDLLESLNTPAYKIASFEATDLPLIRYVASKGKPMIMSTGMCSEEEIAEAVNTAREAGCKELVLLHCISSYPAPMDQANLRQMPNLATRFNSLPGLSDHTLGTTASVAAVALGACVIEKHFTLSRQDKGPDSEFSIEPEELKRLCQDTLDAWSALGRAGFERQKAEEASKRYRRSVYFVRDVKTGQKVTEADIRRIRPGYGLPPKHFDELLGRTVRKDVKRGTAVQWNLLNE